MNRHDGLEVLTALGQRLDVDLAETTDGAWRCLRAVPRIDGSLYFDLTGPNGPARLDWLRALEDPGGEALKVTPVSSEDPIVPICRAALEALGPMVDFGLVQFRNQNLTELAFDDDVVDKLLADRLAQGMTRWGPYVFEAAFQPDAHHFSLTFASPAGPLVFQVSEPGSALLPEQGEPILRSAHFILSLAQDPRPGEQRDRLDHQVERFLGFLLSRAVHPEMRLVVSPTPGAPQAGEGADQGPAGRRSERGGRDPISTTRFANPRQWFQFFSDFEIERSGLCSLRFSDPVADVVHGEAECICIEPTTIGPRIDFANLPFGDQTGVGVQGGRTLFTNLGEAEAVMGGTHKLVAAVQTALDDPAIQIVCVNNTCMPKIIGDDVDSELRRLQAAATKPLLSMNTELGSPAQVLRDLVQQLVQATETTEPSRREGINLVGFPPGRGRRELVRELSEVGIEVHACLLPELGRTELARYQRAALSVVYPHRPWQEMAETVLVDVGPDLVILPAPHGLEGTRKWVGAVAERIGQPGALEQWQERFCAPHETRWRTWVERAREYALAFVIDGTELGRLTAGDRFYGFAILPLLASMGFGLNVLIRTTPDAPDVLTDFNDPLQATLPAGARLEVVPFQDPTELEQALRAPGFQAVYSEVAFDRRVGQAGKAQLRLALLEMGVQGGLRSLERLVTLARWPFFRRYHAHLGTARAGEA